MPFTPLSPEPFQRDQETSLLTVVFAAASRVKPVVDYEPGRLASGELLGTVLEGYLHYCHYQSAIVNKVTAPWYKEARILEEAEPHLSGTARPDQQPRPVHQSWAAGYVGGPRSQKSNNVPFAAVVFLSWVEPGPKDPFPPPPSFVCVRLLPVFSVGSGKHLPHLK